MNAARMSACATLLLIAGLVGHAELGRWVQDIPSPSRLEAVFFRGDVRRPPKETRADLSKLIASSPSQKDLYALRGHEDELQLDFAAAEADWKKAGSQLDLADFYERRIRPKEEIAALETVGNAAAFERVLRVAREQALPGEVTVGAYRMWIARYPADQAVYKNFLQYLVDKKQFADAEKLIADYRKAFPADNIYPMQATATVAWKRGALEDAIGIYDRSFRPLWPPELVKSYFDLLKEAHGLRKYLEQARSQIAARPTDLGAAARMFYYYQQQGNLPAAQRALFEYRLRKDAQKSAFSAEELLTLAKLFEGLSNYDEAARSYYALYSVPGADAASQEEALAGIANLMLGAPELGVRFGAGDLSFYRDIAQLDPGPGFLNGILSLLLNSSDPASHYATDDAASVAYFHRAKAAELVALFDTRFPASAERAGLDARLIDAYATYGDNDGVIRSGREFLSAFPKADERVQVALAMADAYARKNQAQQEFAIYDDLLKELAAKAGGVPIGKTTQAGKPVPQAQAQESRKAAQAEEVGQYARVLDRYIARLVSLKRLRDALALYRREIDRNPNDPGLYERLAAFLEQNRMGAEIEQVYRRAMAQFSDPSWSHKLARWYLRQKQTAQFDQLTQEVVKVFSGTELESYLKDASTGQTLAPVLYRQVNLYAHQRFPHDLMFVRNLLTAYSQRATADAAASEALLRKYWFYANDLRDRFFELLSRTGRLNAELAAMKSATPANPGTQQFVAEAGAWRSHFEEAAPVMQALAADYPADADLGGRAASLYRSLATYDAAGDVKNTRVAAGVEQNLTRATPRDSAALTKLGEIYADREMFSRAKPAWDRIAQIRPGEPNGYLEAATIFWDYYRYEDALRLLGEGRRKLENPALFAYEAGAIYENQRDYRRAIAEYAKGALAADNSQARGRLIQLARRTRDRDAIEQLTMQQASGANPSIAAVNLRADVLSAQNRRPDLERFLLALADQASSLELLARVEQVGANEGFPNVQEHSIRRQIAILTDPIERTRERFALVRFYEGQRNIDAARASMTALYKENPTTLGVVRAMVDFDWRNKAQKDAIDVLIQAASASQPSYRRQFTFEAARKATEAGDYGRARTLLAGLLKDDPFNAEYLAATGDAYGREGNDAGLRDFYAAKMKELAGAPLSTSERTEKMAGLRRGLIPVLTRLKDYAGAVDQYIEIINRYPDDEALVREAALYAAKQGRAQQLTAYYAKTEKDSPKDYRWAMTLARIESGLEHFPAAIAEYRRAADVRPDRIDLFTARASLEERLLRFDDAAATYAKLYELNYHNSQWMEKVAEVRARQGKNDDALAALKRALIEGRPQRAEVFFAMAEKLESWGMVKEARPYAEQGVAAAGGDLLTDFTSGAQIYARIMTRSRAYEAAYKKLNSLVRAQPGDTTAHPELDAVLRQIGTTAAQYFTPEEKLSFANFLGANLPSITAARIRAMMPMAETAGLADLQAKWQNQLLLAEPGGPAQQLADLQQRRLRYGELAGQLEAYWKVYPSDQERDALLEQAAQNYRLAGDVNSELRLLTQMDQNGQLGGGLVKRYADLVSAREPQRFVAVALGDRSEQIRNEFASYAVENFEASRALTVITARGRGMPLVWTRAYTGLVGLYFASPGAQVNAAFRDLLGAETIGERIDRRVDRKLQLAGNGWFYYGSRYGEYLDITKQGDPEDFLPAAVEAQPAHAGAYFTLAEYYREAGHAERAIADYQNALQLDANRGDAHDRMALIDWQQNKRAEAIEEFRAALQALARQQDQRRIPEDFWRAVAATLEDIGQCKVLNSVRTEADRVLRTYVRRNGSYEADLLLRAALRAVGDPAAGVAWVADLSKAAPDQAQFLANIVKQSWIPEDQRPALYGSLIQSTKQKLAETFGEAQGVLETELRNRQLEWVEYLVEHKRVQEAQRALADVPEDVRKARAAQVVPLEVQMAVQAGTLAALLDRYAKDASPSLDAQVLQFAASYLQEHGDRAAARQVLEFVYNRQIDSYLFSAATFLGLAEIRLEQGDVKSAVALLRRMTMVTGEPFENLSNAGELLNKTGHPGEALAFFNDRVHATPWDWAARAQLGRLSTGDQGVQMLKAVAESNDAPYEARASAARSMAQFKASALATVSVELNLLSGAGPIAVASAEKPYFYRARVAAAGQAADASTKIRLLEGAASIEPNIEDVKLQLFDAAYGAKNYQKAVAVFHPLNARSGLRVPVEQEQPRGPGQITDEEPEGRYYSEQFVRGALPLPRRAVLARELADCYAKLKLPREAAFYYGIALQLQPNDGESKAQIKVLQAQLDLERANRERRPVITANLEQDHPVRPRLRVLAGAAGGGQ